MSSRLSELLKRNAFPNEPLDEKDRKIIEAAYKHKHEGVGFNRFVQELKPSVSRSTVAFRVERLCKLGYLERISNSSPGDLKPVRVSFKCFSLLSMLEQVQSKAAKLAQTIREEGSIEENEADADSVRKTYDELRESWNGYFSMIGSVAMLYGERAAADLFLPLIMDDFRHLVSEFFSLLEKRPNDLELVQKIIGERLETQGTSLSSIKDKVLEQQKNWNTKRSHNKESE